jgi:hypothetical protein
MSDRFDLEPDSPPVLGRPGGGRRGRELGVVLVVILLLAALGGFALGRRSSDDGAAALLATRSAGQGDASEDGGLEGGHPFGRVDYLGPPLDLVSRRTTSQGIELIVRAGDLDANTACPRERLVRVGVVASEALVGSVLVATYDPAVAPAGRLGLTGLAEGQPVLVGVIRSTDGEVSARFADGTVDTAEVHDGIAVVAAFASSDATPDELLSSTIEITGGPEGSPGVIEGTPPEPTCPVEPPATDEPGVPDEQPPALPEPGEQPADPVVAEEQVRAAYEGAFDQSSSQEEKVQHIERPEVWLDANQRFLDGPYGDAARDLRAEVDAVVFTSPTHAAVRYQLVTSDDRVPRYQIGDAVLVDGRWLVAITTPCNLLELASVHCDMSL